MGNTKSTHRSVAVADRDAGQRLDRFLATHLTDLSRARLQELIRAGEVSRDGVAVQEARTRVKSGESYAVILPPAKATGLAAETLPLSIVYEDEHLIVIDKPKGVVMHPAPGHASGTLVNALLAHCGASLSGIGGEQRPGIVHRLDKDTTGLVVVAKTDQAHRGLAEQFAAHGADGRLHRGYRALVWGAPERPRGVIDAPLGRSTTNRTKISVTSASRGRRAVTHYECLQSFRGGDGRPLASLIRATLETGRTHQVRVHLTHIGHPVLGDQTYGAGYSASARRLSQAAQTALRAMGRQALHAAELAFEHPVTHRRLRFESPLPPDMAALVAAIGAAGGLERNARQSILKVGPGKIPGR